MPDWTYSLNVEVAYCPSSLTHFLRRFHMKHAGEGSLSAHEVGYVVIKKKNAYIAAFQLENGVLWKCDNSIHLEND